MIVGGNAQLLLLPAAFDACLCVLVSWGREQASVLKRRSAARKQVQLVLAAGTSYYYYY
jgi:hypothetical protein